MKKIFALVVCLLFLVGCAGMTVTANDPNKALGQTAGAYVKLENPEVVPVILPYAQGLLTMAKAGKLKSADVAAAVGLLEQKIKITDKWKTLVLLAAGTFSVEVETGTVNSNLVSLLDGFIAGLSI